MELKKVFRLFQLQVMGFIAIFIGPIVLADAMLIHRLPFPQSISETATMPNMVSMILPFSLGALGLFALTYSAAYAFDNLDKAFTFLMFVGFTIVAMQMCDSQYVNVEHVGLFGLSPGWSASLHSIGAIVGFGSMICWVLLCFRKSDKKKNQRSREKNIRNTLYIYLGAAMVLSLGLFIVNAFGWFGENFPTVFICEWLMLTFGGVACLIKGGLFLRDASEPHSVRHELRRLKEKTSEPTNNLEA